MGRGSGRQDGEHRSSGSRSSPVERAVSRTKQDSEARSVNVKINDTNQSGMYGAPARRKAQVSRYRMYGPHPENQATPTGCG